LDFDGCIHSYTSGWKGYTVIPDAPVSGVFEWIAKILPYFDIHVYSSRSADIHGRIAMYNYVKQYAPHLAEEMYFVEDKSRAMITIDDRCVCFTGNWNDPRLDPQKLLEFKSWYQTSQKLKTP
jgi:hypothetical protein